VGSLTADCNAIDAMLAWVPRKLWICSVGCKSHIWRVGVLSSLRELVCKRRSAGGRRSRFRVWGYLVAKRFYPKARFALLQLSVFAL
jgi:hypothetical protein